ncbi:MAG: hypothetical protein GKR90_01165 [Pseudomonadales bacterium]|nr:hypothetical protein [Pseudomonadales bacterium]
MRKSILLCMIALLPLTAVAEIKRTADGKPDLSGVYDTGTLTPLNRPKEFGDKQFMSADEAKFILGEIQKRFAVLTERESSADRGAPKKGGDGNNTFGAGGVGGYNGFWIDPGSEVSTVNGEYRTSIIYDPPNGQQPSMVPAAMGKMSFVYGSFSHQNDGTASWLAKEGPGPFDLLESEWPGNTAGEE